ncbi:ACT domain-containing protein [Actinoplanes sp. CA-015351]|uniref:ACT domain-containing protein n=1 Tax=Actinoplanes sp. CA-015351 TaxID=3239897 RepID=UPI003D96A857
MKPFDRFRVSHWATELIEVAAVFFAVGTVHLFVTLVGEHAHGEMMLMASAAILLAGALLRRRWRAGHRRPQTAPQRHASLHDLLAIPAKDRELMRLRTTLPDRPGTLAGLSSRLAARGINILAVQIHPGERGAVDELLVAVPREISAQDVVATVAAGGGEETEVSRADVHDLVDPATRALSIAAEVAAGNVTAGEAVRRLLGAELAVDAGYADPHAAALRGPGGVPLYLVRSSPVLTPTEISRAQALVDLCSHMAATRR